VSVLVRLFAIKNTMGYGLNSFLDHLRPIDILLHLLVGSEGTLAFVAEATFRTVPIKPAISTGLLIFPTLADATGSLPALAATGPATIELLDATSLRVAQSDPVAGEKLRALDVDQHAALLVEYQEPDGAALADRLASAESALAALGFPTATEFSTDSRIRADLWHIRKGLYATVAGNRPSGTTALLEDIAVPVANLLPTCQGLLELFDEFEYEDSVIFGHAKDGNIHFLLNERFEEGGSRDRHLAFTDRMVELVLSQGGTLKAEHGTGRVMAPFVRRQYGDELYEVMVEIKRLFDPHGSLNVGVLLNDDPVSHVSNLKTSPTVEKEVDRCVECGYCEPACPSKDLTVTPRQRIVLRRELERARLAGDRALVQDLEKDYEYDGIDTCAADGMCQVACPVLIDTGELVKRLRAERPDGGIGLAWNELATAWGPVTSAGGLALSFAKVVPAPLVTAATAVGRAVLGAENVPLWERDLPRGGAPRRPRKAARPVAVYVPACIGTMFGPVEGSMGVQDAFLSLTDRAGLEVRVPDGIGGMCCGTPWKSKGHTIGYEQMRSRMLEDLWEATDFGQIPVVCDATSCTEGLIRMIETTHPGIRVVDAVAFVDQHVLPRLTVQHKIGSLVLHPTCSSTHLGLNDALSRIGGAVADRVDIPIDWGCCAFAGDRGMLHPELTASATAREAAAVLAAGEYDGYASLNRTCELGLTRATGKDYRHVLELLEIATKPDEK
jgi:D-lactate dehydrogenase